MARLFTGEPADCPCWRDAAAPCPAQARRAFRRERSATLANAPAFERDHLARQQWQLGGFWNLLGNPEQPLATFHLLPHFLQVDTGGDPKHHEVVEQIGA